MTPVGRPVQIGGKEGLLDRLSDDSTKLAKQCSSNSLFAKKKFEKALFIMLLFSFKQEYDIV